MQTVLGPIAPEALGPTLMHEHLLCDIRPPAKRTPAALGPELALDNVWAINYGTVENAARNYLLDARDVATEEVRRMLAAGGRSVVDLSSGGLSPDPAGLVAIARATGAHVVMGCGHYVHDYQDPANAGRSVEDFAEEMVESVTDGAWGTDVRAGIIGEIGCQAPWTPQEQRVMLAAVLAQRQTGAAINVHPGRHPDQPKEVADFIRVKGGRMDRVIISHIDRTVFDDERLRRLADTGCVLEWDLFGQESSYYRLADIDMPNDAVRLRAIRRLIARGHLAQVLISHDICYRSRLVRFGGHGYGHIFANVVPMMRRRGFSEAEIQAILVDNPRRLLTLA
ncbi:MAG TPA: aryldialkylphosphatase [Methylomirabilota bacterium]|nr:aryldialkylphosphatase [Methylomirabilota bacterium]